MSTEKDLREKIHSRLKKIYGDYPSSMVSELIREIKRINKDIPYGAEKWSEKHAYLITYGDTFLSEKEMPLKVLSSFLKKYIGNTFSHLHILPFFPYSSDDGFSVIDFYEVDPSIGTWKDIKQIGKDYNLMFDLVINHVSKFSKWFQNFLLEKEPGEGYFITIGPNADLTQVVRPRSLPLLTVFHSDRGSKEVWTTFSSDQADLNFANPEVLKQMLKALLFYLEKGAKVIRLDAIAYIWKEIGTGCIHRPETHEIVKLMRDIKDYIDPAIILITETNVPNKENLSYFGTGDEADMVYQFSLPPLLLHALFSGTSQYINQWAKTLEEIPSGCSYFNFTASHDGIGVRPLEGILPEKEIHKLTQAMKSSGGFVSTRRNADGKDTPYEINITYFDALRLTKNGLDDYQYERFISSQTIMMSLQGVPAFYIHSLLGTMNALDNVERTGMPRSINRKKWVIDELNPLLKNDSMHSRIHKELINRIKIRTHERAFHPESKQKILEAGKNVFSFTRGDNNELLIVANLLPKTLYFDYSVSRSFNDKMTDVLSGEKYLPEAIKLNPYQVLWLKKADN
jgi:glycosidase